MISHDQIKNIKKERTKEYYKNIDEKQDKYLEHIPKSYKYLFLSVFSKKYSLTKALKAKCLDCSNFDQKNITNCTITTCPLHHYRPYQDNQDNQDSKS